MPMNLPSSQRPKSPVGKQPPSGDAEDSRSEFPNVSADGGGVLPTGNGQQNLAAQGGRDPTTGEGAYDDGGVVPSDNMDDGGPDQGADDATLDPMSFVKAALAHGRKKMGQPATFYPSTDNESNGPIGSFDDGGEVGDDQSGQGVIPQPGNQAVGGEQPVDPRSTMAYLAGAGAVPPEMAAALEQQADPQGTMDPSERKLRAIQMAGDPDKAFGLMQRYRSQSNAHMGAARAALDKGNLAQAAHSATQAFANIPTGHSVQFAPAGRGMAVHARPVGQRQTPGFDMGGDVAGLLMQQGFDDGGEVDDQPEQGAIDRLDVEPSQNIEDRRGEPPKVGADGKLLPSETWTDTGRRLANKWVDLTYGQSPRAQGVLDTGEPDEGGGADTGAVSQPVVTPVQAFKQLLGAGYDKIIEQGGNLGNYLAGLVRSDTKPTEPAPERPAAPPVLEPGGGSSMPASGGGTPTQRDIGDYFKPGTQVTPELEAEYRGRGLSKSHGDLGGEWAGASQREREIRMQASRLFGWDTEKRNNYIDRMLGEDAKTQGKEHLTEIATARKGALQDIHDQHIAERTNANNEAKAARERETQGNVNTRAGAQNVRIAANEYLRQHPNAKPDEIKKYLQGLGYDPAALSGAGQDTSPGGAAPPKQPSQGAAPGNTLKFYQGQWYKRGPNGEAVPVQANGL